MSPGSPAHHHRPHRGQERYLLSECSFSFRNLPFISELSLGCNVVSTQEASWLLGTPAPTPEATLTLLPSLLQTAIDILTTVVRNTKPPLSQLLICQAFPAVAQCTLHTDDNATMQVSEPWWLEKGGPRVG